MFRTFVLALVVGGFWLAAAPAQVVRPIPRPTPRANPPAVKSTPTPSRRQIIDRKNGAKKGKTPTSNPGGSGTPGAAGPAGAKGPKKPSTKMKRTAGKRLKMRGSLMRSARTEIWSGEIVIPTEKKGEFRPKVKVELRRSRDGSVAQRFTYQRRGDLPEATRLVRRDAKGTQGWWLFRPEDRRVAKVSASDRLAESALKFQDLVTLNLETLRARFIEKKVLDKKVVYVYHVAALATSEEPVVRVYVRNDTNLVSRIEYLDAANKVRRQVLFSLPRSYGVHKRWTKIVVHDLESGRSATVLLKEIRINPDISDLRFLPTKLSS